MRVIVLGAGLLGVASAYYLQHLGHDVTVVDRHSAPAARLMRGEGMPPAQPPFDNSAPLSAAALVPAAGWPRMLRRLGRRLRPLLAPRPRDASDDLAWLDAYSHETLQALLEDTGLPPARHIRPGVGQLDIYTAAGAFARAARRCARLRALGSQRLPLSADEALRLEPALAHIRPSLAGAIYSAAGDDGERDDPRDFASELVQLCRASGVRFLMNHEVVHLHDVQGEVAHVELRDPSGQTRHLRAHAYVMALGRGSVPHLARLGIAPTRVAARDDVVTMPVLDARRANRLVLRDQARGLRFARCSTGEGDVLRVSGTVRDDAGHRRPEHERFEAILRRTAALLPGAADLGAAQFQTTTRPSRGTMPLIGRTRLPNLFLNAAQGPMHWVNACGAGKSIAWIVTGLRPPLQFAFTGL